MLIMHAIHCSPLRENCVCYGNGKSKCCKTYGSRDNSKSIQNNLKLGV